MNEESQAVTPTDAPAKRPRGNPSWAKGKSANPGGVVPPSKKTFRLALLRILESKAGPIEKLPKPKTRCDELAQELFKSAFVHGYVKGAVRMRAMAMLIERVEGRSMPSVEETEAIAASGRVLIIDRAGRPPRTPEE